MRVVGSRIFDHQSLIVDYILEGPDALVSCNRVISEVDVGLRANLVAEHDEVLVLKVVRLVVLAVSIDDWVEIVQREIELRGKVREKLVDISLWITRPAGSV